MDVHAHLTAVDEDLGGAVLVGAREDAVVVRRCAQLVDLLLEELDLLLGFLERYLGFFMPGDVAREIGYSLANDVLLLASLLVLGGDFWDKIRALFIREAKVQFPSVHRDS